MKLSFKSAVQYGTPCFYEMGGVGVHTPCVEGQEKTSTDASPAQMATTSKY